MLLFFLLQRPACAQVPSESPVSQMKQAAEEFQVKKQPLVSFFCPGSVPAPVNAALVQAIFSVVKRILLPVDRVAERIPGKLPQRSEAQCKQVFSIPRIFRRGLLPHLCKKPFSFFHRKNRRFEQVLSYEFSGGVKYLFMRTLFGRTQDRQTSVLPICIGFQKCLRFFRRDRFQDRQIMHPSLQIRPEGRLFLHNIHITVFERLHLLQTVQRRRSTDPVQQFIEIQIGIG